MRWLLKMLRSSYNNALKREVIFTALSLDFPGEDTGRQIQTLIAWRRYAELLTFDDGSESISLKPDMIREKV
jgi:NitT/TauT family transport system ATP-binding protein